MIYAQIANGGVLQTRSADESPGPDWRLVVDSPIPGFDPTTQYAVQAGWETTPDTAWTLWVVLNLPPPDAPVVLSGTDPVPQTIPLWSFRAILTVMGLVPKVETLIATLPEPDKTVATTQWQYGNFIDRGHPLIQACGAKLGMSEAQVDGVFRQAGQLK
jgi:hypothetical protein